MSRLNELYPRKRKLGTKYGAGAKRRNQDASSVVTDEDASNYVAESFITNTITLFGRRTGLIRDVFIKSIRFDSPLSCVSIKRAYKEAAGSVRCEESNVDYDLLLPEGTLHISNVYFGETFGLRIELENANFIVDQPSRQYSLLTLDGYFGRSVALHAFAAYPPGGKDSSCKSPESTCGEMPLHAETDEGGLDS